MPTPFSSKLLLTCLWLLITAARAQALSVAIFPTDDLSQATNSTQQEMTLALRQEVTRHGLTVIPQQQVEGFMASHRIRQLGALPGQEIVSAGEELEADLVLLASLCEQSESTNTVGLTLSLIRSADAKTIWTSSAGVSLFAEQRLLGVDAPTTLADLQGLLFRELFASWPTEIAVASPPSPAPSQQVSARVATEAEVQSVLFTPKYVRPGQEVTCTIRFTLPQASDQAKVFIRVGNRVHTAQSEDGRSYRVSWVGEEGKIGRPLQVAMNSPEARVINGVFSGEPVDASYPVSLILEWASGQRQESYLGAYVVDSHPPEPSLKAQAKTLEGQPAFRGELPIAVRLKRREPIEKWAFAVTAADGPVLLEEKGSDQPPESFRWRGQDAKNQHLAPGLYDLSITVWDRAGNRGEAHQRVRLLSQRPGLDLTISQGQGKTWATLSAREGVGISYWRLELWGEDNTMLKAFAGQSLPTRVEVPTGLGRGKTACLVQVKDSLGMKATKKVEDLLALAAKPAPTADGTTPPAADDWQADF